MRKGSKGTSPRGAAFPLSGQPAAVQLDGRTFYAWWGQDRLGNDCLAHQEGRLEVAYSEADMWDAAAVHGWEAAGEEAPQEQDAGGDQDAVVTDVDEVRSWLSGAARAVPATAALNVWNLATDVAYSLRRERADHGYWADRAYEKLFAANVPWAVGLASYRPRWARQELTVLRRVEGDAVGLLRDALTRR
jgi:hypothetical protein